MTRPIFLIISLSIQVLRRPRIVCTYKDRQHVSPLYHVSVYYTHTDTRIFQAKRGVERMAMLTNINNLFGSSYDLEQF